MVKVCVCGMGMGVGVGVRGPFVGVWELGVWN